MSAIIVSWEHVTLMPYTVIANWLNGVLSIHPFSLWNWMDGQLCSLFCSFIHFFYENE